MFLRHYNMHGIYIHAHLKIKSERLIQENMTYRYRENYDSDELEKYLRKLKTTDHHSSHAVRKLNTTDYRSSSSSDESESEDLEKAKSQGKRAAQNIAYRRKLREAEQFFENSVDAMNKASESKLAIEKLVGQFKHMKRAYRNEEEMRKSPEYEAVIRATRKESASMKWFTVQAKQHEAGYKNALLEAELLKPAHENLQ